jgi:hypothetical protein
LSLLVGGVVFSPVGAAKGLAPALKKRKLEELYGRL